MKYTQKKLFITRAPDSYSSSAHYPITLDEWRTFVSEQPDLRLREYVEIPRKGGQPVRFKKDGLAEWLGHPSGEPVRLNYFWGYLEFTNPDDPTCKRASEIAVSLGARIQEEELERDDEE